MNRPSIDELYMQKIEDMLIQAEFLADEGEAATARFLQDEALAMAEAFDRQDEILWIEVSRA